MSKYKSKMYAGALVAVLAGKKIDDRKVVANFLALLRKNQDVKKAKEIILLTEKMLLEKSGNKKVILETARKTDTGNFIKSFAKKGDAVEEKINPALIAGIKVVVDDDKQLDMSLKSKLERIF